LAARPTLVRKINADDKRQAAELIELDGGDWARAARHSQGHMASLLKQAALDLRLNERAWGRLRTASTDAPQEREVQRSVRCHLAVVIWLPREGRPRWLDSERFRFSPRTRGFRGNLSVR
jgi:hypothetical protein